MSKIQYLTNSIDHRLRRVERQMAANDAWLTRLMAPPGRGKASTFQAFVGRFCSKRRTSARADA